VTLQIGRENPRHHFRDVPAHATFLLGQTAPVITLPRTLWIL